MKENVFNIMCSFYQMPEEVNKNLQNFNNAIEDKFFIKNIVKRSIEEDKKMTDLANLNFLFSKIQEFPNKFTKCIKLMHNKDNFQRDKCENTITEGKTLMMQVGIK